MAELLCCKRIDFADYKVQKNEIVFEQQKRETEKGTGFSFMKRKQKIIFVKN